MSEAVVYSFTGGSDGCAPAAQLVAIGADLYGTTNQCGANGFGTVFQLTP